MPHISTNSLRNISNYTLCRYMSTQQAAAPLLSAAEVTRQLRPFFQQLASQRPRQPPCADESRRVLQIQQNTMGFVLGLWPSLIQGAGQGVFCVSGRVSRGAVAAIYPGTVYEPSQPLLLQSIKNKFILMRKDGFLIDGNDRFLSKSIFRSLAKRDASMQSTNIACDDSWLAFYQHSRNVESMGEKPTLDLTLKQYELFPVRNPLAIGHYVNDGSIETSGSALKYLRHKRIQYLMSLIGLDRGEQAAEAAPTISGSGPNVAYLEYDFRESDWSQEELKYVSNLHYSIPDEGERIIKSMVLVALRDIECGEELLSSYLT